jgi:uncharacterized iron-regulated protein
MSRSQTASIPPRLAWAALALAVLTAGCGAAGTRHADVTDDDDGPAHAAPPLERACRVFDGRSGEEVALRPLARRLARADVVFLGETHLDETTHRLQLHLLAELIALRDGEVILAMEQFERDVQPAIDDYLAGRSDETAFRAKSRPWGNYATDYRPLIELAKARGIEVVASNVPRAVARKIATGGAAAFAALDATEKTLVARELLPSSARYWQRVENAIRGHAAMGGGTPAPDSDERRFATQSLWDNTMAESIALATRRRPGALVVHVNGGFHSAHFDGTVAQLIAREPHLEVATVAIDPVDDVGLASGRKSDEPVADFVAAVARIASSREGDAFHVSVARDAEYLFHLPHGVTNPPLLLVLPHDGVAAEDVLAREKARLGREAAIAVLRPLNPWRGDDLGRSGSFLAGDDFGRDVFAARAAAAAAASYLLRNYELDASRVAIAGEAEAAAVAAGIALHTERLFTHAVAIAPRQQRGLADFPLPRVEDDADRARDRRTIRVLTTPGDTEALEWWRAEMAQWGVTRADGAAAELAADPFEAGGQVEDALRAALAIEAGDRGEQRFHVVLAAGTPRARIWGERLLASSPDAAGARVAVVTPAADPATLEGSVAIVPPLAAEDLAKSHAIPRASGPFGGTTVLVLPESIGDEERDAFVALEGDDPLTRASRFHRLRIATHEASGERSLRTVLEKLAGENRRNVLIVPATFAADAATMRRIEASVADIAPRFTLSFAPGLGGGG